jgi:integrase
VIELIDRIVQRGAEVQANRTLARLRAFFNWAVAKDRVAASPAAGILLPTKEQARERVLTDDEIRWLWQACDVIGWPFGPFAKLLLLTAQRRDEVAGMERAELDLAARLWTIPAARTKNGRLHAVHISDAAHEVLRSLPRIGERLALTTDGEIPIAGFSNAKRRLDVAMAKAAGKSVPHWTFHDLRRTATTGMARLNVPPHVVDKVLNHTSGTIRGVAAVYNRFEYRDQRREALEAWGRFVGALASGEAPGNVVALRA